MTPREALAVLNQRDAERGAELQRRIDALPALSEEDLAALSVPTTVDDMAALLDRLEAGQGAKVKYRVEVLRTVSTSVEIEAVTPKDAVDQVGRSTFPLPELGDWNSLDEWEFIVYDAADRDRELYRED